MEKLRDAARAQIRRKKISELPSFPCFPRLPPEIRVMIWFETMAQDGHRIVGVFGDDNAKSVDPSPYFVTMHGERYQVPKCFLVSVECRAEALKYYNMRIAITHSIEKPWVSATFHHHFVMAPADILFVPEDFAQDWIFEGDTPKIRNIMRVYSRPFAQPHSPKFSRRAGRREELLRYKQFQTLAHIRFKLGIDTEELLRMQDVALNPKWMTGVNWRTGSLTGEAVRRALRAVRTHGTLEWPRGWELPHFLDRLQMGSQDVVDWIDKMKTMLPNGIENDKTFELLHDICGSGNMPISFHFPAESFQGETTVHCEQYQRYRGAHSKVRQICYDLQA